MMIFSNELFNRLFYAFNEKLNLPSEYLIFDIVYFHAHINTRLNFLYRSAPVGKPTMTVGKLSDETLVVSLLIIPFSLLLTMIITKVLRHLNVHFSLFISLDAAHNTSSSSVRISWKAPPLSTIHGEFLGYRITYRPRDKQQTEDIKEIYIRDSSVEVCGIINMNYDSTRAPMNVYT